MAFHLLQVLSLSLHSLTRTRLVILLIIIPQPVFLCSLVLLLFLGLPRNRPVLLALPLKLSIMLWLLLLQRFLGCTFSSKNCIFFSHMFLFCGVIMLQQLPSLPILCFILARNTLELTICNTPHNFI